MSTAIRILLPGDSDKVIYFNLYLRSSQHEFCYLSGWSNQVSDINIYYDNSVDKFF